MNYYLMNKDNKILEFTINPSPLGEEVKTVKSFTNIYPIGFTDIYTWLNNRNYAKHKNHLKKWLKEWKIDTLSGFVDITHCLSINDSLWVKSVDSSLSWHNVNLYHNNFDDIAEKTAFDTGLYGGLNLSSTSPEFTLEGTCPKCWKKEDYDIFLYKVGFSGATNLGKEPYSEYMASNIVKQLLNKKTVSYDLVMFNDKLCSKCKLFTDENNGFIPIYRLLDANKSYTINDLLAFCKELGFEQDFREMIFTDSIIFNQDRHLGNFGFIIDNDTYEIKSFAPLFDYNLSMLCNALDEDLEDFSKYENNYYLGHKLGGTFSDVGKEILTPELKSLPLKDIEFPIHDKYNLSNQRLIKLKSIFEDNISKILNKKQFTVQFSEDIEENRNYS